jgi:hypothetical protein
MKLLMHAPELAIRYVGINLRGANIRMPEKHLD